MNTQKILFAWLLTIAFGSMLLTLFFAMLGNGNFLYFIVSGIISAVLSLPTLIVQLIVNSTNSQKEPRQHIKAVNLAHLIMFLVTLLVGNGIIALDGGSLYILFTGATLLYAIVAAIVWYILLKPDQKNDENQQTIIE